MVSSRHIHVPLLLIVFGFISNNASCQKSKDASELGWGTWQHDTIYHDNGSLKQTRKIKWNNSLRFSTNNQSRVVTTKYNQEGKWYHKQRIHIKSGCFHFKTRTIWTRRRRKRMDVKN